MPTYTYIVYRCPQCKADVGRRFGLHTKLNIVCPNCRANVRIGPDVIRQNWGFNFGLIGGVTVWLILGALVLMDQDIAKAIARNTTPVDTFEQRLGLAAMMALPGFLAGLVTGVVGVVLGSIVAAGAWNDEAAPPSWPSSGRGPEPTGDPFLPPSLAGSRRLETMGLAGGPSSAPTSLSPPQPRGRHILVRIFFILLWPVIGFAGGVIVLALVAMSTAKPDAPPPAAAASTVGLIAAPAGQGPLVAAASLIPREAREEARREEASKDVGGKSAPWLLLATLVVFVLGCVGLLPLTGSGKKRPAERRPDAGKPTEPAPSSAWRYDFQNQPSVQAPPEPPKRHFLIRAFFVLLWPAVFFFGAALTAAALAGGFSAANEEVQKHIFKQSAEANVLWIMLGSLVLFVVGCLGFLPGTGAKKRKAA